MAKRWSVEDNRERLIARAATVDAMTYQEKRAILDEFGVKATVHPASHPFRYEVDLAFEIDGLTVMASDYYGESYPDMTGEPLPGQAAFSLPTS